MPSPLSLAGVEVLFHAFVSSHMDQYAPFAGLPVPARIINRLKLVHHAPTILHQAPGERHAHSQPSSCTHIPGMLKQVQGADGHYFFQNFDVDYFLRPKSISTSLLLMSRALPKQYFFISHSEKIVQHPDFRPVLELLCSIQLLLSHSHCSTYTSQKSLHFSNSLFSQYKYK